MLSINHIENTLAPPPKRPPHTRISSAVSSELPLSLSLSLSLSLPVLWLCGSDSGSDPRSGYNHRHLLSSVPTTSTQRRVRLYVRMYVHTASTRPPVRLMTMSIIVCGPAHLPRVFRASAGNDARQGMPVLAVNAR